VNQAERGVVEAALLAERAQVLDNLGHFDERAKDLRDRAGDLSLYRQHPADVGSEANQQEQDFLLGSVEGRRLYQIDEALERLYRDPEGFGVCESCGRAIAAERLAMVPETRLCAEHAIEAEAGLAEG
jgi:RNA polymerase-binding transcription factor DksA